MGAKNPGSGQAAVFIDALSAACLAELRRLPPITAGQLDEQKAVSFAAAVCRSICHQFARVVIYVPTTTADDIEKRDCAIWASYQQDGPFGARKFSSLRVAQLARQHELTTGQVYCIVRLRRSLELAARTRLAADPARALSIAANVVAPVTVERIGT